MCRHGKRRSQFDMSRRTNLRRWFAERLVASCRWTGWKWVPVGWSSRLQSRNQSWGICRLHSKWTGVKSGRVGMWPMDSNPLGFRPSLLEHISNTNVDLCLNLDTEICTLLWWLNCVFAAAISKTHEVMHLGCCPVEDRELDWRNLQRMLRLP